MLRPCSKVPPPRVVPRGGPRRRRRKILLDKKSMAAVVVRYKMKGKKEERLDFSFLSPGRKKTLVAPCPLSTTVIPLLLSPPFLPVFSRITKGQVQYNLPTRVVHKMAVSHYSRGSLADPFRIPLELEHTTLGGSSGDPQEIPHSSVTPA